MESPLPTPGIFRHLLVAVDGSDNAIRAARTAGRLAQSFGSRLTLLSVYRHISYTNRRYTQIRVGPFDTASPVELSLRAIAEESLADTAALLDDYRLERVEQLVRRGSAAATILKCARDLHVDTIILGCRGLGEIEGLLLGSVSHKVNALAHCTCITVR